MDVLEIDAASNTGVDNVRELRDSARYAPSRDRNKIFIIDEVHMLSTSAFNALLKILEEPPSHVVFIMATTERHKVPATILSRCQQFVFRTIAPQEIQAHLKEIVAREGVTIDDTGLSYIVKASEGSMRDAQSLLDQIIAFGGEGVAGDDVRDVLGFISNDILDRTITAIAEGNSQDLIETVGIVVDQGLNLPQYARELIGRMRDLLMIKLGLHDKVLGSEVDKLALAQKAQVFSEQDLIRHFDLLLKLESDLRFTAQPRFHLEVGLVKLAKTGKMRDIEEVLRDLRQGKEPTPLPTRPNVVATAAPPTPKLASPTPAPAAAVRPKAVADTESDIIKPAKAEERPPTPAAAPTKRTGDDKSLSSAKEEPLVKRFLEVFRGDIAQVKPPKGETQ
jgi:DNA polymerase-3 subunit gamma/tau